MSSKNKLFVAYFDGACYPTNPNGDMGVGAVIYDNMSEPVVLDKQGFFKQKPSDNWKEVFKYNKFYPFSSGEFKTTTNNVAEYLAFIEICTFFTEKISPDNTVIICGDSNLVIKQMSGIWGIKEGAYYEYAVKARNIYHSLPQKSKFLSWIPRELNEIADGLSKLK